MKTIAIKNFRGMTTEEDLWSQGYAKYCANMDVWGLGDNTAKISSPGVLQAMKLMNAGSEAAATNDVTDTIMHFAYYPTSGTIWGMSAEGSPRLYERDGGAWTLKRSTSGSDLATASASGSLAFFGNSLWVAQNARVSRWTGSVWTASFMALSNAVDHPMKIIAGKLAIADGNFIATIDSAYASNAAALTLPSNFNIRSMEVLGDNLYIFADNGSYSRLFIWNGTATTYTSFLDIEHSTAPYLCFANGQLWVVPPINNSASTPIYTFNGSSFVKEFSIPLLSVQTNRDAVLPYRDGLVIVSNNNSTTFEDGTAGLWFINKHTSGVGYQYGLGLTVASLTQTDVGGAIVFGTNIYAGSRNTTTYSVYEVGNADTATTTGIWDSHPITGDNPAKLKFWRSLQLNSELKNDTNRTIVVKYRLDHATTWTTLVTVNASDNIPNRELFIGKTSRVIEIRFELTSPSSNTSTRLHDFSLTYDEKNI